MRVTISDLAIASHYLKAFSHGDHAEELQRVADWLMNEIVTRNTRRVAKKRGKSMAEVRALISDAERYAL